MGDWFHQLATGCTLSAANTRVTIRVITAYNSGPLPVTEVARIVSPAKLYFTEIPPVIQWAVELGSVAARLYFAAALLSVT
jgi:hypothetical protein